MTAWIFRFNSPERKETWTLRYLDGEGMVVVERGTGTMTYLGTASDGKLLTVTLESGSNKLSLECKREKRAVCSGKTTTTIDLLDCYHPDYKAPMAFAPAPGLEYSPNSCKQAGDYTLIAP